MAKSKARNSRAKELLPYLVLSLIVIAALLFVSGRYTGLITSPTCSDLTCSYLTANSLATLQKYDTDKNGQISLSENLACTHSYVYGNATMDELCSVQNAWQKGCNFSTTNISTICTDSDGGLNYYVKGTTKGLYVGGLWVGSNNTILTKTDYCYSGRPDWPNTNGTGQSLAEFYCTDNSYLDVNTFTCPNGCNDGACISTPTSSITPVVGMTVYNSTSPAPYSTMYYLNGVKVTSLINEKILGGITYDEFYVLFDKSTSKVVIGFMDRNTNRIFVPSPTPNVFSAPYVTDFNMHEICPAASSTTPVSTSVITEVTGNTVYNSTSSSSYSFITNLNGVRITTPIEYNGIWYNQFYILFDTISGKVVLGFYDPSTARIFAPSSLIVNINMNDICPGPNLTAVSGYFQYMGTSHHYHTTLINNTEYRFVFDDSISPSDFNYSSATTRSYQNPIHITVAGKDFNIVAIPSVFSFRALSGSVGWITTNSTTGLIVDSLTALVTYVYASGAAAIKIVDGNGNLVKDLGVLNIGDTYIFTYGGNNYSIQLLNIVPAGVAGVATGSAQIAFSQGSSVDNVYDGSSTATIPDWGPNWKISGSFATYGIVTSGDYIRLLNVTSFLGKCSPCFPAGAAVAYINHNADSLVIIVGPSTISNTKVIVGGTSVSGTPTTGAPGTYIIFNSSGLFAGDVGVTVQYTDAANGLTHSVTATLHGASSIPSITVISPNGGEKWIMGYTYDVNWTNTAGTNVRIELIKGDNAVMNWGPIYPAVTTYNILLPTSLQTGSDYKIIITSLDVNNAADYKYYDASNALFSIVSSSSIQLKDYPTIVSNPLVVIGANANLVDMAGMGDIIASLPRTTSSIARLSSEVTTADKLRNLILVGGPCVNDLVTELATAGKFPYTCSNWPGQNLGIIFAIQNAYAAGENVIVVAGTTGMDTRVTSQVLQDYATELGTITTNCVKVIGTSVNTASIAAC